MALTLQGKLPPEIWADIFGCATCEPGALGNQPSHILQNPDIKRSQSRTHQNRSYKRSISVKCTLVQVCKAWRSLAIVNLYEDVRLPFEYADGRIISYLHALTLRTWNGHPIGCFTKRLDISWHYLQHAENGKVADIALIQFLQTCPQLSIFIVDGWIATIQPERLVCLSAALDDKPLRRLRFVHYGTIPLEPFHSIPSLVTLSIPLRSKLALPPMILPSIRSLTLDLAAGGKVITLQFPNLQQIFIASISTFRIHSNFVEMAEFIEQNGMNVLSLGIEDMSGFLNGRPELPPGDTLRPIMSSLPRLKEFTLDHVDVDNFIQFLDGASQVFKGITTFRQVTYDNFQLKSVRSIKNVFPDLSTIQFSCDADVACRETNASQFKQAARFGIRVYDGGWRLLNS